MGNEFRTLQVAVKAQFDKMSKGSAKLFKVGIDRDQVFETYLKAFPEGTNPLYKERTEHDCRVCKQFIRQAGGIVGIDKDLNMVSIWDFKIDNFYQEVVDAMSSYVKALVIVNPLLVNERKIGTLKNFQQLEDGGVKKWDHLCVDIPSRLYSRDLGTELGNYNTTKAVFKRGLAEITVDSMVTTLDLIKQNSLPRGAEQKKGVEWFLKTKKAFDLVTPEKQDLFCWKNALGAHPRLRNSSIGTLLVDLSNEVPLMEAVGKYDSKMAPQNYKRSKALVTPAMKKKAKDKIIELGLERSLQRRFAEIDDLSINNVLYADRSVAILKDSVDELDALFAGVPEKPKSFDTVEEVTIDTFLKDIMPGATKLEMNFDPVHENNLMSLVAPANDDAPGMFKWDSPFSWDYNGGVADSMKDRVKKAGGKVDGDVRFSIQWNEDGSSDTSIDLDAHCKFPGGHIYFSRMKHLPSGGKLDVDNTHPGDRIAVENITWADVAQMKDGLYDFYVHNYSRGMCRGGFSAEIELLGEIHKFSYTRCIGGRSNVRVAKVRLKNGVFTFVEKMGSTMSQKDVWNIKTNTFHTVAMVLNSPNHWDGEETGNKHTFFILENCLNPDSARGFFNEFLHGDLWEDRKVFEFMGDVMKTPGSDKQLSGLGFSSTIKKSVLCRVTGTFTRVVKINF